MTKKKDTKIVGIVKNTFLISAVVLIGKVLGFVKQAVIAWAFGSNSITDIYFAADGYTSMFGQIMGQSVGPTVLTQYVELSEKGKDGESKRLIHNSFLFFAVFSIAVVLINIALSKQVCDIIGISYTSKQKEELRFFLLALSPVMLFTSMTGVSSGYLDSHNAFLPGRLASLFFSICIIISVFAFRNILGLRSLLYGFLLGYILHMLWMLCLTLRRTGFSLSNPFSNPAFRSMIKRFVPLVIGVSVVDLGHLVDRIVASSLEAGSVSTLHYGQVISSDIVNSVLITSVGTVLLTSLSRSVASKTNLMDLIQQMKDIICTLTFLAGLVSVLYFIEGRDLVKVFFERGNFTDQNSVAASYVAIFYSFGFIFMANREVLIKAHYAFHDTLSPMINSLVGVAVNVVGSILFSRVLGVGGVALATSISLLAVAAMSVFSLKKHLNQFIIDKECASDFIKTIVAMLSCGLVGSILSSSLSNIHVVMRLSIVGVCMMVLYIGVGLFLHEKMVSRLVLRIQNRKD